MLAYLTAKPAGTSNLMLWLAVILFFAAAALYLIALVRPVLAVGAALVAAGLGCLALAFLVH